jgi:hypothetical protein
MFFRGNTSAGYRHYPRHPFLWCKEFRSKCDIYLWKWYNNDPNPSLAKSFSLEPRKVNAGLNIRQGPEKLALTARYAKKIIWIRSINIKWVM